MDWRSKSPSQTPARPRSEQRKRDDESRDPRSRSWQANEEVGRQHEAWRRSGSCCRYRLQGDDPDGNRHRPAVSRLSAERARRCGADRCLSGDRTGAHRRAGSLRARRGAVAHQTEVRHSGERPRHRERGFVGRGVRRRRWVRRHQLRQLLSGGSAERAAFSDGARNCGIRPRCSGKTRKCPG